MNVQLSGDPSLRLPGDKPIFRCSKGHEWYAGSVPDRLRIGDLESFCLRCFIEHVRANCGTIEEFHP